MVKAAGAKEWTEDMEETMIAYPLFQECGYESVSGDVELRRINVEATLKGQQSGPWKWVQPEKSVTRTKDGLHVGYGQEKNQNDHTLGKFVLEKGRHGMADGK